MKLKRRHAVGLLSAFLLVLFGSGCFEVDDKSDRFLRLLYSSDIVGNIEPCG